MLQAAQGWTHGRYFHATNLRPGGHKLYPTHSGATSDKVTVYDIAANEPAIELRGEFTTGANPFGLAWVP